MSLPYTMVFTLLMTEMVVFIFLILPLPFKWRRGLLKFLAESPFMGSVQYVMKIVFIFVFILFIDSLNRVIKVEEIKENTYPHHGHGAETNVAARRFYAQRNMYLTGFTLFLSLILNRTFFLILDLLKSEEKMEVIKKQASQQSKEYERVLESETKLKKEIKDLSEIVASHAGAKRDLENLQKQATQQQKEYLRMADENNAMEMKLLGTKSELKKDI
ncbi:B-cell receptor-associated protein 31-like-domain-containing protein [Lobosporangium transversale]|uniref:Endoplasmic reticulum transmembrane protein n=1 Tax=Lobosporangium transversale TaxID=64571 RepID=A0A1Y2GNI7_9FUNG|nr:B-cell receptor-associated protein 31-like-domain-containing protein [Lobosporangium transversale]ORZ16741.1 B-cell receptor-associated protein 31-like-domain-containing protein [Lobosporangium transversale]|eukprot:XP_021881676.1 B-cell receptor-associated protein 31-like-domain-containing protein [Lobosporangium transversale]